MRWCVTFDRGMFFIAGSSIFIFSGWLLCRTAFIQTAPSVWIARSSELNTRKTAWNDIHQSKYVSIRDQVNFMLSFTVTQLWRMTFFCFIIWKKPFTEIFPGRRVPIWTKNYNFIYGYFIGSINHFTVHRPGDWKCCFLNYTTPKI